MRIRRTLGLVIIAGVLSTALVACAGATEESGGGPCDVKVSTDTKTEPTITIPDCAAPTGLQTRDVVAGDGPAAKAGDTVVVKYSGVSWSTKEKFDASWNRGANETFPVSPLGQASVIQGWNDGLLGAKKGMRRLLVIPPDMGYGAQGRPPRIKPNETLVFVVDVVSVGQ